MTQDKVTRGTTALSTPAGSILTAPQRITPEEIELFRQTVAKDATDAELKMHLFNCRRLGVHPLDGRLAFVVRKDRRTGVRRYAPIASIDLYRSRADATGMYAGNDEPVIEREEGAAFPSRAVATVWKIVNGERVCFTAAARWPEFYPGDGPEGFQWRQMPDHMLAKCAESLALRKAFPQALEQLAIAEVAPASRENGSDHPGQRQIEELMEVPADPGSVVTPFGKERKGACIRDLSPKELSEGIAYCVQKSIHPSWIMAARMHQRAEEIKRRIQTAASVEDVEKVCADAVEFEQSGSVTENQATDLITLADAKMASLRSENS